MYVGQRYSVLATLWWSRRVVFLPLVYAAGVTALHELTPAILSIPWVPVSAVGVAVAFYLGFKNNASYDRLWEARKIWGAIVNASRSWAYSTRDLVSPVHLPEDADVDLDEIDAVREQLVHRHIAWMDALRHQLRQLKSWEHRGRAFDRYRRSSGAPEYIEDLAEVLTEHLGEDEATEVLAKINPAAHLLANQSRQLAEVRSWGLLDGFAHIELQAVLKELMAQQGKAERIKNFPFPRQYATVNSIFAWIFTLLLPCAMLSEFEALGPDMVWLTVPFSGLVGWVFLTTDRIGDWSENPFEGLANDVPISTMARGIERDVLEILGQADLPPSRSTVANMQM